MKLFTRIQARFHERGQIAAVRRHLCSPVLEVQAEALYLLVSLHDTWGLRRALRHAEPWVRREAIKSLAPFNGARAARWLVHALTDTDRSVMHTAAECLGRMKDPKIFWALRRCVASEDWLVRYHGTVGLAHLSGQSPEVDRLLATLAHDEQSWVRNTATQALRRSASHACAGGEVSQ